MSLLSSFGCSPNFLRRNGLFFWALLSLSVFLAVILYFFLSKGFLRAQTLDSCSIVINPRPGINCSYLGLPRCNTVSNPLPRQNCADVIDLPLCSEFASSANPGNNCVSECTSAADQIHNQNCIRFCNSSPGSDCIYRKCHHFSSVQASADPLYSTCNSIECNLLTVEELDDPKFNDDSKKYCEGSWVKCYAFNKQQLPYVKFRKNNTMCQIHECYGPVCLTTNDTLNITSKNSTSRPISNCTNSSTEYQCIYQKTFNRDNNNNPDATKDVTIDVTSSSGQNASICKMSSCKAEIGKAYLECTGANKNIAASQCGGNSCSDGYCLATDVDCNLDVNSNLDICKSSESDLPLDDNIQTDPNHQSWFYRPTPPNNGSINTRGELSLGRNYQRDNLCYNVSDLRDNDFGTDTFIFGWWYAIWDNQHKKMPICDENRAGTRGLGYSYLCSPGTIFSAPTLGGQDGFIDGDVMAFYPGSTKDIGYKIRACLRYKNMFNLSVCGSRECKLSCAFTDLCDQWCGYDVCRDLTVREGSPDRCSYAKTPDLFGKSRSQIQSDGQSYDCVTDSIWDVRMRTVKYGRRVCVFLDHKGTNGGIYFDGKSLKDGTCVDGDKLEDGSCRGFNHNHNDGLIDLGKWRAVTTFQYIGDYEDSGGYTRVDGKFFKETQCALAPMKIGPSRFYNIGNKFNSPNLFGPPLYISGFSLKRGDDVVNSGTTDFFFPELEVAFGNTKRRLSLGPGFVDGASISNDQWVAECNSYAANKDKTNCRSSPPFINSLETKYNDFPYYADLFVRKEYNSLVRKPTFCLYRRAFDENGLAKLPIQIGCVERSLPEVMKINPVNNKAVLNFDVDPDAGNKFNQAKIKFKLFNSPYSDSNQITLEDPDLTGSSSKSCARIEEHQFCAKRDDCSKLYYECANNKIALNNAINTGASVIELDRFEQECNGILRQNCNRKKGITTSSANDIYTQTNANSPPNPNAYGWYNEICINRGLESKLRKVVAYKVSDTMGKCLIDQIRSVSSNCNDGGRAPDCVCLEYREGINISADQEVRVETPREAGFCINIPKPNYCSAIDHTPSANLTDPSDPNFINNSLDKSLYSDASGVHSSHQTRANSSVYGRAEFASAIEGMNLVNGKCNGFWKVGMGNPKMNCNKNTDSSKESGVWSNLQNSCVRYKCPAITNAIIGADGNYHPDYSNANFESGENKGVLNGFALWPQLIKTNDFVEMATATSCIVGFKPEGSASQISGGKIVSYSGGNLPERKCNQLGVWKELLPNSGSCQRIYCSTQNIPANPNNEQDFALWANWGGAWFNATTGTVDNPNIIPTPASRGTSFATAGSTITGSCNTNAGFYQMPGAPLPTRTCDSLGNWLAVENPCVTRCDAVTDRSLAATSGNGFATWPGALDLPIGSSRTVFGTCVSGYVSNPYPTILDDGSTPASLPVLTPPQPSRTCSPVTSNGVTANVWSEVVNPCVNYCPGYDQDSRVNAGLTRHAHSVNGTQDVNWSKKNFSDIEFKSNCPETAAAFAPDRANGCYILKRQCTNNGKWSSVVPMCSGNNGRIGNATYFFGISGERGSVALAGGELANGVCVSGYWPPRSTLQSPTRVCHYKDSQQKIDQVFLDLNGSSDCQPITCSINNGQVFDNSVYNGGSRNDIAQGEVINLSTAPGKCGTSSLKLTCKVDNNTPSFLKSGIDARDCRSCNQDNDIFWLYRIIPLSKTNGCVDETRSLGYVFDSVRNCSDRSFVFSRPHNSTILIGWYFEIYCWIPAGNKGICLKSRLRCNDGQWEFAENLSHTNGCYSDWHDGEVTAHCVYDNHDNYTDSQRAMKTIYY